MGMVLAGLGFVSGCLYCVRILNKITGILLVFALFWYTLGVSLMTGEFVQARNRFRDQGLKASLGRYAFGFSFAAWACLFLAIISFFIAGKKEHDHVYRTGKERRSSSRGSITNGTAPTTTERGRFNYVPFYKRNRHVAANGFDKETV